MGAGVLTALTGQGRSATQQTLSITPAIVDAVLAPGSALPSIQVSNTTQVVFRIRIYPALVDQNLDGSLSIRSSVAALKAARRLFSLSPRQLRLSPGRSAAVSGRFIRAPDGLPAAYAAAVVEAVPSSSPRIGPTYRVRLLGALLIVKPAAPPPVGRIVSIRVTQVGVRRLRFVARIRNAGRVHGYPRGLRLLVRDRHGRVLFQTAPRPGVVLPHYRRDYSVDLFRLLPAGRYTVRAVATFGRSHLHRAATFTLVRPNRLRQA